MVAALASRDIRTESGGGNAALRPLMGKRRVEQIDAALAAMEAEVSKPRPRSRDEKYLQA